MSNHAPQLDQIFPGPLPGHAIHEQRLDARTAKSLPMTLREAYDIAQAAGVPVKIVTCRLPGTPARPDGSHEIQVIVPQSRSIVLAGTTI